MDEPFDYFQCQFCDTVQIETIPEDLGRFYGAQRYYSFNNIHRESQWRLLIKRSIVASFVGRPERYPSGSGFFSRLRRNCQPWLATVPGLTRRSRILDVGCGEGARLNTLASLGFSDLTGIDPFLPQDKAGTNRNGVRLVSGELADHHEQYDLITMHHSLEHVPDPLALLEAARERLAPGGAIYVGIPLLQKDIWARYGVDWAQLDAPRHLYLFAPDAFRTYAAKAGLKEITSGTNTGAWSLAWSEAYRAGHAMFSPDGAPNPLPFTPERMTAFRREAEALNAQGKGDQGYFVLVPL